MKKTIIAVLLLAGFALTGCQKEKNDQEAKIKAYESVLTEKYPNAGGFEWSVKTIDDFVYDFAEFTYSTQSKGSYKAKAWFEREKGKWSMTETEIPFEELPDLVKEAFLSSEFASWQIDEVEKLERNGLEIKYEIEVEKGDSEADLYYSPDGILLEVVLDDPENDNSGSLPSPSYDDMYEDVMAFIDTHYPGAILIDFNVKHDFIKVKVIHENRKKQIRFDLDVNWLLTKYEVAREEVAPIVIDAFNNSSFASYEIDEIEFYETPQENYYVFELENNDDDIEIKITMDGAITVIEDGGGNNGVELDPSIVEFINTRYPGAEIIKADFEEQKIEVEIRHEGFEKEVVFERETLNWIETSWEVNWENVPEPVHNAVATAAYAQYKVDDVHYVETESQVYYLVELEADNLPDIVLRITPEGVIL